MSTPKNSLNFYIDPIAHDGGTAAGAAMYLWHHILNNSQPTKIYPYGKKKKVDPQPIGVGMTAKQMKRRKPINSEFLLEIDPLTDNQSKLYDSFDDDKNIVAYGAAGTGKYFITFYNALRDVLDENTPYEKIYIVRSLVATREIGFLPGTHEDKADIYQIPYKNMDKYMFPDGN